MGFSLDLGVTQYTHSGITDWMGSAWNRHTTVAVTHGQGENILSTAGGDNNYIPTGHKNEWPEEQYKQMHGKSICLIKSNPASETKTVPAEKNIRQHSFLYYLLYL